MADMVTKTPKHKEKCMVCNSPDRKAIEKDYIAGMSLREIELQWLDISHMSMWRHINAYPGLRKRRTDNIEAIIDRIIDNGVLNKDKIDGRLILEATKLKLKLAGRIDQPDKKGDNITNVTVEIREATLERGLNRFGVIVNNEPNNN